jgi:hypothetical protein
MLKRGTVELDTEAKEIIKMVEIKSSECAGYLIFLKSP